MRQIGWVLAFSALSLVGCRTNVCGDGVIGADEVCDDGGDSATCTSMCALSECGDLYVNEAAGEQCDTGAASATTCDPDCTNVECGDGTLNMVAGEECDDGNAVDGDGCSQSCVVEVCGDGVVNNNNGTEACDDGAANSDTLADACRTDCSLPICGDDVVDTGEECDPPDSILCDAACLCIGGICGTPTGYRAIDLRVLQPAPLGIVNGIIASGIMDLDFNFLMRVNTPIPPATTIEAGSGDPGVAAGEFLFNPSPPNSFAATFDVVTGNMTTTSTTLPVGFTIAIDTDGDGIDDLFIPMNIYPVPGEPLFDLFFLPDYSEISATSRIVGGITVDEACMVNIDLGGGTLLNLLDILDGSTGMTTPPDLTPPCAAGTGADNIQPGVDTDGDGTNDAYRVELQVEASCPGGGPACITITN